MAERKRPKKFTKHLELISRFDQFCDYTSVVGFRLLKSENPRWVRFLTACALVGFCVMVFIQTRDAFQRFLDPASKPIPRFEASQTDPIPRPGLLICTQNQIAFVLTNLQTFTLENSDLGEIDEELVESVRKKLKYFPEIFGYLNFNDFYVDPYIFLQIHNYHTFSKLQSALDDCWARNWKNTDKKSSFVECRWNKAKKLFEQFRYFNLNYFEYYQNVSLKFEDLFLTVNFHKTTFTHKRHWHVDYGACELLEPDKKEFDGTEVGDTINDTVVLRTQNFDSRLTDTTYMFLYDSVGDRILNKIDLISEEYLEIQLTGFSEIQNELCQNSYSSGCLKIQKRDTPYSWNHCKWCEAWYKV
ncbi:hypothetical protein M3Y97_00961300 [Aphelenchoides bicaudatus]|nr:hypothetical protein M3Y97_00961300 [Aphelenchoides bicaudatus]